MDEYTHIIQNIVYARDPKIFDNKNGFVNQRGAFMHENLLDVKAMVLMNEARAGAGERVGMPRMPMFKKVAKTKAQLQHELELRKKAIYTLKQTEDGRIDRNDKTLLFESKFECGNLYLA